jgi:endonuclease YncB( thermonuclease family)
MIRFIIFAFTLTPFLAYAGNCKVIDVSDGDTFVCFTEENEQIKVRLAEIDAPEMGQPYGSNAKQSLSQVISSEMVKLNVQDTDSYGRTVARVTRMDGVDVNAQQVRAGAAWVYPKHLKDKSLLVLEAEAKNNQRGLWAQPSSTQVAPWEWRDAKRVATAPAEPAQQKRQTSFSQLDSTATSTGSSNCNNLKWCGQMTCAQARQQLAQCGSQQIDGDGDGIPCEDQCR